MHKLTVGLFFVALLTTCQSSSINSSSAEFEHYDPKNRKLIEMNKTQRPDWVSHVQSHASPLKIDGRNRAVFKALGLRNLALGIHQVQKIGLANIQYDSRLHKPQTNNAYSWQLEDLYYEKVQYIRNLEARHSYDLYVLFKKAKPQPRDFNVNQP